MGFLNKKKRKSRKQKKAPSGSYVKTGLAKLAAEARRRATSSTCTCADRQRCAHADAIWAGRADKLESVGGELAVGLWDLRDHAAFWQAVDVAKIKVVGKRMEQSRPNRGKSLKRGLHMLRQEARKKAADAMCHCAPWEDCPHDPERDGGVWSDRYRKLKSLSMEAALELLPHLGASDVWTAVDLLGSPDGQAAEHTTRASTPVGDHRAEGSSLAASA